MLRAAAAAASEGNAAKGRTRVRPGMFSPRARLERHQAKINGQLAKLEETEANASASAKESKAQRQRRRRQAKEQAHQTKRANELARVTHCEGPVAGSPGRSESWSEEVGQGGLPPGGRCSFAALLADARPS